MIRRIASLFWAGVVLFVVSAACNFSGLTEIDLSPTPAPAVASLEAQASIIPTPLPPALLTICMGKEPASLFTYADASVASRSIRQAIYDGPYDMVGFDWSPVLLQEKPGLENGAVRFEPLFVQTGNIIVDGSGGLTRLSSGVLYRPVGCENAACALVYSGQEPVQMDQMVVRFVLRSGVLWSDGAPLSADDSLYSFEIARSLYPNVRADLLGRTQSYVVTDPQTIEWRGVPGFRTSSYLANFFPPLPRHLWGGMPPEDLLVSELVNRQPLGWGAYVLEEWTAGDHISLRRNANYFRSPEGLPYFERLVFRFIPDQAQAVNALLAGECDYLDETVALDATDATLLELSRAGSIRLAVAPGSAWEHLDFGIASYDPQRAGAPLPFFQQKETRQAVALCIDRQRLNTELFQGLSQVPDSYVPAGHPSFNPQVKKYAFDPLAAAAVLEAVGWQDADSDPATPRLSQAVAGIPDGTPFKVQFLTTTESEKQRAAQVISQSLAQCGIQVEIDSRPWEEVFAAGPQGLVFGRSFSLAQFGWVSAVEPPCFLYTTSEIPGPYPEFIKGWGGANAGGFSNAQFDQACADALLALPGTPAYQTAHAQAQAIFAEELPALPLYLRLKVVAMRPTLCGMTLDPSAESALWNLENYQSGEACR